MTKANSRVVDGGVCARGRETGQQGHASGGVDGDGQQDGGFEDGPGLGPIGAPRGRFPGRLCPGVARYRRMPPRFAGGEPGSDHTLRDKWDGPGLAAVSDSPQWEVSG